VAQLFSLGGLAVTKYMKSKYVFLAAVFVVALVAGLFYFRGREKLQTPTPITHADLTKDEQHLYQIVRDIPGDLVVRESLERETNSTVVVTFYLDQSKTKMQNMGYNLTTLAKKQHELGMSDEDFKARLKR
jgi:hypothetical protein